jgi:PilZ domain
MRPSHLSTLGGQVEGPESELRADPRYKTALAVLVTNLSRATQATQGLLLDVSTTGIRIEATSPFHIGDAVRVDLQDFMVLAEVVHYIVISERVEVGLKLVHSLDLEDLDRFVQPLWAELLGPKHPATQNRSRPVLIKQ